MNIVAMDKDGNVSAASTGGAPLRLQRTDMRQYEEAQRLHVAAGVERGQRPAPEPRLERRNPCCRLTRRTALLPLPARPASERPPAQAAAPSAMIRRRSASKRIGRFGVVHRGDQRPVKQRAGQLRHAREDGGAANAVHERRRVTHLSDLPAANDAETGAAVRFQRRRPWCSALRT